MRMISLLLTLLAAGCATKPASKSQQQQVDLAARTGNYTYLRALSSPGAR